MITNFKFREGVLTWNVTLASFSMSKNTIALLSKVHGQPRHLI